MNENSKYTILGTCILCKRERQVYRREYANHDICDECLDINKTERPDNFFCCVCGEEKQQNELYYTYDLAGNYLIQRCKACKDIDIMVTSTCYKCKREYKEEYNIVKIYSPKEDAYVPVCHSCHKEWELIVVRNIPIFKSHKDRWKDF